MHLVIFGAVTTIVGAASHANSHFAVGLWPLIAGLSLHLFELSIALARANRIENAVLLATLGVAAALGPGSRSVDAKPSRRKRTQIRNA
jgi:hypothetical protein